MLQSHDIETAEQFRQMQPEWVRAKMSVVGLRTWKELNGEPCIEFEHKTPDKQSITVSRSFAKELKDIEPLQESLSTFVSMAAEKLRCQNSVAGQMQIVMFDEIDRTKHKASMQTIDSLNVHHGRSTIMLDAQGSGGIPSNRNHTSPRYTTEWSEIVVVKV